jgi:putative membrane protein
MVGMSSSQRKQMRKNTKQLSFIKELLMGFCLGTANIIPGVSGGTFLLIFKIYERVFSILNSINKANILCFFACIINLVFKSDKAHSLNIFMEFLRKNDFIFLLKLIVGAVVAIISLSSVMKYLIVYHFSLTYSLFFGLILVSLVIPVKMLRQKKAYLLFFVILGAVCTIYVSYAVNPYEKVKKKSDFYAGQYLEDQAPGQEKRGGTAFSFTGKYRFDEYGYALICGAVAVSAMVLPGISGSLVLILMGEYFEIISAISGLKTLNWDNLAFLGCFGIGVIVGGLLFAKFVSAVLKRYYNATMAFLMGLMAGSLYALWPFKQSIIMAQQYIKNDGLICVVQNMRIYTNINEFPQMGSQLLFSLVSFIIGCVIMSFFIGREFQK